MTPDWAHAEELDALAEERDEARRELEELRSAAREVIYPTPVYTIEWSEDDARDIAREKAETRLAALLGVEDTTEPTEEAHDAADA